MSIEILCYKLRALCLITALTLVLPGAVSAENAKFDPASGTLQIPVVEVPGATEPECYLANFGLVPSSDPLTFSLKDAQSIKCTDDDFISFNHQQTLNLTGIWNFTNSTQPKKYILTDIREATDIPGEFFISGIEEFSGNKVVAGYNSTFEDFSLLEIGTELNYFYTFTLSTEKSVAGCYYEYETGADFEECLDFTGVLSTQKLGKQSQDRSVQLLNRLNNLR